MKNNVNPVKGSAEDNDLHSMLSLLEKSAPDYDLISLFKYVKENGASDYESDFMNFLYRYRKRTERLGGLLSSIGIVQFVVSLAFFVSAISFVILISMHGLVNYPAILGTLACLTISSFICIFLNIVGKYVPCSMKKYIDLEDAQYLIKNQKLKKISESNEPNPKAKVKEIRKGTANSSAIVCDTLLHYGFNLLLDITFAVLALLSLLAFKGEVISAELLAPLLIATAVFFAFSFFASLVENFSFNALFGARMTPAISLAKLLNRWDYELDGVLNTDKVPEDYRVSSSGKIVVIEADQQYPDKAKGQDSKRPEEKTQTTPDDRSDISM